MPLVVNETQVRNIRTGNIGVYAGSQHTIDGKEVVRVNYLNTGNNRKNFTVTVDMQNLVVVRDGREIPFAEENIPIQNCIRCDQVILGNSVLCNECREKETQKWEKILDRLEDDKPIKKTDKPEIKKLMVGVKAAHKEHQNGKPDSDFIIGRLAREGICIQMYQVLGIVYHIIRRGKNNAA